MEAAADRDLRAEEARRNSTAPLLAFRGIDLVSWPKFGGASIDYSLGEVNLRNANGGGNLTKT